MKKIILVIAISFLSLQLSAQQYVESVYLKNGSIIKGTVIEQVPNGNIKIQRKDGSVYVYPMSEVVKITKEQAVPAAPVATVTNPAGGNPPATTESKTTIRLPEWWEGNEYKRIVNSRFGFNCGIGLSPSNMKKTFMQDPNYVNMVASGAKISGGSGFSVHLNPLWTSFFNDESRWFYDVGLLAECNRVSVHSSVSTAKVITRISNWYLGPQVNIGMCLLQNKNAIGGQIYWKAGLSAGWILDARGVVEGYMDGEIVSYDEVSNNGGTKFAIKPNIEVGFTVTNTFTRFGLRYSPTFIPGLTCHPISFVMQVGFWGKKTRDKYHEVPLN